MADDTAPPTPPEETAPEEITPEPIPPVSDAGAPNWRRTLAVMIGLQVGMNAGFTVLSPIMPLFLPKIGIEDPALVNLWAGILASITPLLAAIVSPLWGRVADRRGAQADGAPIVLRDRRLHRPDEPRAERVAVARACGR